VFVTLNRPKAGCGLVSNPLLVEKEKIMKKAFSTILGIILVALVFWMSGCGLETQLGETSAEGHRRHLRNLAVNQQEMMGDIDRVLLLDKPSKLTDKRIN
jgi:hypothetical protein